MKIIPHPQNKKRGLKMCCINLLCSSALIRRIKMQLFFQFRSKDLIISHEPWIKRGCSCNAVILHRLLRSVFPGRFPPPSLQNVPLTQLSCQYYSSAVWFWICISLLGLVPTYLETKLWKSDFFVYIYCLVMIIEQDPSSSLYSRVRV